MSLARISSRLTHENWHSVIHVYNSIMLIMTGLGFIFMWCSKHSS